jgi:hypothetical protein
VIRPPRPPALTECAWPAGPAAESSCPAGLCAERRPIVATTLVGPNGIDRLPEPETERVRKRMEDADDVTAVWFLLVYAKYVEYEPTPLLGQLNIMATGELLSRFVPSDIVDRAMAVYYGEAELPPGADVLPFPGGPTGA